jgi:hypothetical protein
LAIDDARLIHIVGMYKCGTSWLTRVFASHPEIIAWREFDIIRTVYNSSRVSALGRLEQKLGVSLPARWRPGLQPREPAAITRDLFCGRGWIPFMDADARSAAAALDTQDSERFLDGLLELGDLSLRRDNAPPLAPARFSKPLGIVQSRRADIIEFMNAVQSCQEPTQIPGLFFSYLQSQAEPGVTMVLKAADQIPCLPQLIKCSPRSRKLAIIRDGRDAAISALHFNRLMQKRDAPWKGRAVGFNGRLRAWSSRAAQLAEYARRDEVLVLRYEDLKRDFHGTSAAMFERLGLSTSLQVIDDIYRETDFTAMSGGRKPGEAADEVVRKGITGEWKTELDSKQADAAWKLVGKEMSLFGYTRDGEYLPSELCIAAQST